MVVLVVLVVVVVVLVVALMVVVVASHYCYRESHHQDHQNHHQDHQNHHQDHQKRLRQPYSGTVFRKQPIYVESPLRRVSFTPRSMNRLFIDYKSATGTLFRTSVPNTVSEPL